MKKRILKLLVMGISYSAIGITCQLFLFSMLYASDLEAQKIKSIKDVSVQIEFNDAQLLDVFKYLEKNTDYNFVFDKKDNYLKEKMNFVKQKMTVEELLFEISKTSKLEFKQINNNISVKRIDGKAVPIEIIVQGITITGKVISEEDNTALPGVNVVVKGTTIGTVTDIEGIYSLEVPDENTVLNFSSVGYAHEEVVVGNRTVIDIALTPDITALEEIVVVGYGSQISREVTGAVQQMDAEELKDIPVAQVTQKLQGRMAGVQINQATGTPGQGMKVRIRGQASVNSGSDPLYVVDGFPIVGDISTINPDEIENISVLKDAASTSLYGSRAANGVILITTKSGKAGKGTSIGINAYYGVQQVPQKGRPDMMNATEFATFLGERLEDIGQPLPDYLQNPAQYGEGTDWYDYMLRTAPIQNYNVTLTTANDRVRASAVLGYFCQDGVMKNSDFERYSFRLNSEFQITDQLKLGVNLAPNYSIRNSPNSDGAFFTGGIFYNAMLTNPMVEPVNEDGTIPLRAVFPGIGFQSNPNPYRAMTDITDRTKELRMLSNAFVEYTPIEGLSLKSTINFDASSRDYLRFEPTTVSLQFWVAPPRSSQSTRSNRNYTSWLNENLITYTKDFGDHNLSLLGGITFQEYSEHLEQITAQQFSDDRIKAIQTAGLIVTGPGLGDSRSGYQEWGLISYLGRLNYNYKGKYLFTAAIRRDGSSRFGEDNRWGNFPSASAGWVISDELFLSNVNKLSFLKLRASWGIVGNNNIGNYTHFANVSMTETAVFNGVAVPGFAVNSIANTDLGWETTEQIDIGLDLGLFDDRIALTYDFYTKNTTDLLYEVAVPQESGYENYQTNLGEFKFWGHEITLNTKNLVGEFRWTTDFNISFNRNEAVSLVPGVDRLYGGTEDYTTLTIPGEPIGQFWGMDWDGVYVDQQDFDNSPKADASAVGTIKYRDVNGDGVITYGGDEDDRLFIGNPTPDFIYGFTNTFNYKNFDLSVVCSGSQGNDIFVVLDQGAANLDGVFNVYKDIVDRWRSPENPGSGRYGTTTQDAGNERDWGSDRFIDDGSYFAIKNLTLGYNLPVTQGKALKNVRFYGSIQQVALFTSYRGVNPEVSTSQGGDQDQVTATSLGFDYGAYPIPRTYTLGVNIGF